MAQKNILIYLSNSDPNYLDSNVRYARIDNTVSPVYTTISNVTANPLSIPNVDNGQYRIYARPFFSDGRSCAEVSIETAICAGITAFNAVYNDPDIDITYTADADVPFVKVNLQYPNGGSFSQVYTNGDTITITPPVNVFGTFFANIQPVCDVDTGWIGAATGNASFEIVETSP